MANSYLSINSEKAVQVADAAVFTQTNRHLKDVEVAILQGACQGRNYKQIAENYGCTADYLRNDVGPQFWKFLSKVLGEKVSKKNFRTALERRYRKQLETAKKSHKHLSSRSSPEIEATTTQMLEWVSDELVGISQHQDWGKAPDVPTFYGRTAELATLRQWIVDEHCRLVALLGIGGIGKTALSIKLAQQLSDEFDYIIWRSLCNAPPLFELLGELLLFLSQQQETNLPETVDGRILRLLHYLRSSRCLLILDNGEAILESGIITGRYQAGYELYSQLLNCIGETQHKSCLLLTSREKPLELTASEGETLRTRSFRLTGLPSREGQQIFSTKGSFSGSEEEWETLNFRYSGNPLILKIVASTVRDFFDSNLSNFLVFLQQDSFIFDDIRSLLQQQFQRLSELEKEIMYWIAINRKPVSLQQLQEDFIYPLSADKLLQGLVSLQRRALIEKEDTGLTQQPIIMEYITNELIERLSQDLIIML